MINVGEGGVLNWNYTTARIGATSARDLPWGLSPYHTTSTPRGSRLTFRGATPPPPQYCGPSAALAMLGFRVPVEPLRLLPNDATQDFKKASVPVEAEAGSAAVKIFRKQEQ